MVQRFVLIHERSIKEWTRATDFLSSWQFLKTNRFGDANRRGSPSRIEGLGSSIEGVKGKSSPCGVWGKAPGILSRHGVIWRSQQGLAEPTPNVIWYSVLYQNFGFALSICYDSLKSSPLMEDNCEGKT